MPFLDSPETSKASARRPFLAIFSCIIALVIIVSALAAFIMIFASALGDNPVYDLELIISTMIVILLGLGASGFVLGIIAFSSRVSAKVLP
jgi:hypothetical protein